MKTYTHKPSQSLGYEVPEIPRMDSQNTKDFIKEPLENVSPISTRTYFSFLERLQQPHLSNLEIKDLTQRGSSFDVNINNREMKFDYQGQKVLVVQKSPNFGSLSYVVVPGYIRSTHLNGFGTLISEVEPIVDPSQKRELSDLIRNSGMTGSISFWD